MNKFQFISSALRVWNKIPSSTKHDLYAVITGAADKRRAVASAVTAGLRRTAIEKVRAAEFDAEMARNASLRD